MSESRDYNDEVQELFLRFLVSDPDLFARCQNIVTPSHFNRKLQKAVEFIMEHSTDHNTIPTLDQISAMGGVKLDIVEGITIDHQNWFLKEFEEFCRHKALEEAIIASTDLLESGHYGDVETMIKEAVQTSLVKDLGIDYYENPKERLEWIKGQGGAIPTGWRDIDHKLYGGLNRGEITIFAGGSGAGKSLFLQNFGVNWSEAGLNVVYISLELSEKLISLRLDSMVTGIAARSVMHNIDDVHMKVGIKRKTAGAFRVKQMPSGVNANDIRAFLREYEIQTGTKIDALLIDYLDLLSPISTKISASDLFVKDKMVAEELRNLAIERDILCVTASQLNRASVDEVHFDHSHIAGGISKINTADNVVGIFTSDAMRERGRYQIQFMKTRSSAGIGSKVDLAFNIDTLRIEDLEEGEEDAVTSQTAGLLDKLKRNNAIKEEDETAATTPMDKSLNLQQFLKNDSD